MAAALFVGRDEEAEALLRAVEAAQTGTAHVVVVEGVAGIGKTALVHRVLDGLSNIRLVCAEADEMETDLEYGMAEQLLGGSASEASDPLTVGADLTAAITTDDDRTTVVLVEDVHWADDASLQALGFAVRRSRDARLVAILTSRPEGIAKLPTALRRMAEGDDGTWIKLAGLDIDQLRVLAHSYGHELSRHDVEALQQHTGGVPLYARALLSEYGPGALVEGLRGPLPAPSTFAAVIFARLVRCSRDVEALVSAAAVIGEKARLADAIRLSGLDDAFPALDEAIKAGLLEAGTTEADDELRWPHPLVRSAIYHDLAPGRRAVLHHAAAELFEDDPRVALRHRIAGAFGPDDEVAREAEAWAIEEVARGAWFAAESAFLNAARLSTSSEDKHRRRLSAIGCAAAAGDMHRARRLQQESHLDDSAFALYIAGALAATERNPEAQELLERAWTKVDPDANADLAARIASQLAALFGGSMQMYAAVEWGERAVQLNAGAPIAGDDPVTHYLRALGAVGRAHDGLELLRTQPHLVAGRDADWPRGWIGRATLRLWTDDLDGATADLNHALEVTRWKGPAPSWVQALTTLAEVDYRAGRWDDAVSRGQLALSIATDAHFVGLGRVARVALAMPLASRAERGAVRDLLRPMLEARTTEASGVRALYAMALLADAEGDPERVLRTLTPIARIGDWPVVSEPGPFPWRHLYIGALIRTGDLVSAERQLNVLMSLAYERGLASAQARAWRVTGLLYAAKGEHDAAVAALREAIALAASLPMPFTRALIDLDVGAVLRRTGQRKEAANHIGVARAVFERLGASTYVSRCDGELSTADIGRREPKTAGKAALTPAEQSVLHLVMKGLAPREIAAELVVSVRTVEAHLGRIYRKYNVNSRAQLVAVVAAESAKIT